MQLLRLADVPIQRSDRIFAYSRLRAGFAAASILATACAAFLFGWLREAWLAYMLATVLLLSLLIFHRLVLARFRRSNWLVRAGNEGLFIHFRSYLNHHFDDRDLTVVFFPYSEIRSAEVARERRELPEQSPGNRQQTERSTRRLIDLEVSSDCTALSRLLGNERERVFGKSVIGAGRISLRYQHLPVRLGGPKRLRLEWGVVPDAAALLDILASHGVPQQAAAVTTDYTQLEKLPKTEQEERLLALIAGGDELGAVALARRLYSCDLAAAKRFIEELVQRRSGG